MDMPDSDSVSWATSGEIQDVAHGADMVAAAALRRKTAWKMAMGVVAVAVLVSLIAVVATSGGGEGEQKIDDVEAEVVTRRYDLQRDGSPRSSFRSVALANGLRALLVSSPGTSKAAAALNVGVGSYSDPPEYQGLAHFLEHMLFRGSGRYPEDNYFTKVLANYQGTDNAYTAGENTNYFFDCVPDGLPEVLDIFAGFFDNPLFDADAVATEVNAVHNEHAKNKNNDGWRFQALERLLAVASGRGNANETSPPTPNPFSQFGTGDLKHLNKPGVRDALIDFHKKYYYLERMTLVVLSPAGLDDIEALAQRSFGTIPPARHAAADKRIPAYDDPANWGGLPYPFPAGRTRQRVVASPAAPSTRWLMLRFATPLTKRELRFPDASTDLLTFVLEDEGPGSLKTEAVKAGLALGVSAGAYFTEGWFSTFLVEVELTAAGEARVDDITAMFFAYLRAVRAKGWRAYYEKMVAARAVQWNLEVTQNMAGLVSALAERYARLPTAENVLLPPANLRFNPDVLAGLLEAVTPDNAALIVFSEAVANTVDLDKVDSDYGTRYRVDPLTDAQVAAWYAAAAGSTDAAGGVLEHLVAPETALRYRTTVAEAEALHVPLRDLPALDDRFAAPEATAPRRVEQGSVEAYIQRSFSTRPVSAFVVRVYPTTAYETPAAGASYSPRFECVRMIAAAAFERLASDVLADAGMAGMSGRVTIGHAALDITVEGLSPAQPQLLDDVLTLLRDLPLKLKADADLFAFAQKKVRAAIKAETTTGYVYKHGVRYLLQELSWATDLERAVAEVDAVLPDDVHDFMWTFLTPDTACQTLLLGSFVDEASQAHDLHAAFLRLNLCAATTCSDATRKLGMRDIAGWSVVQRPNPNSMPSNDCALAIYQLGPDTPAVEARARLVGAIIGDKAFDQLRSKEALGYVAFCQVKLFVGEWALVCGVQGSANTADYLDARIENFVGAFAGVLAAMPAGMFATVRESQREQVLRAPVSLGDEIAVTWPAITARTYEYGALARVGDVLDALTQDELVEFVRGATVTSPKKLSVELFRDGTPAAWALPQAAAYNESTSTAGPMRVAAGAIAAVQEPAVLNTTRVCAV